MSWKSWAWAVAGTVTAVEVSKERKLYRWSSKNQHQNVINNVGSEVSTETQRSSSSLSSFTSSRMVSKRRERENKYAINLKNHLEQSCT